VLVNALGLWQQRDEAYRATAIAQGADEFENAASEFGVAAEALSSYRITVGDAESAHTAINSEAFEAEAVAYGDEVWASLRVDSYDEIDARESFLSGEQSRASGLSSLLDAELAWGNEE